MFQIAWATVVHMSHNGGGMKLRDLTRGSSSPTSFMPAFHIFRSRFWNRETSRHSRESYEFVHAFSSALSILTPLQQATMGPVLSFLHRPRHPGSYVTLPIRTHIETFVRVRAPDLPPRMLESLNFQAESAQSIPRGSGRRRLI